MSLDTPSDRLQWARARRFPNQTPTEVAKRHGWTVSTYLGHENGDRNPSRNAAKKYGRAYGVRWEWVLEGDGSPDLPKTHQRAPVARLVGFVSAGPDAQFMPAGDLGEVDAGTFEVTPDTVAVQVRGTSIGRMLDRSLLFYNEVRRPVTPDLVGQLCVVGLEDGRILVKWLQKGPSRGRYHLVSETEPPILDAKIEWAAPVRHIVPNKAAR